MFKKAGIILFCLTFAGLAAGVESSESAEAVSKIKKGTRAWYSRYLDPVDPQLKNNAPDPAIRQAIKERRARAGEEAEEELEAESRGLCPHCADNSANLEREEVTNPNEVSAIVDAGESSSPSKKAKSSEGSKGLQ